MREPLVFTYSLVIQESEVERYVRGLSPTAAHSPGNIAEIALAQLAEPHANRIKAEACRAFKKVAEEFAAEQILASIKESK